MTMNATVTGDDTGSWATPHGDMAFRCPLPHLPEAVAPVRRRAHTVLTSWNLPAATIEDAVLVISELVTNAVTHARPPAVLHLSRPLALSATMIGAACNAIAVPLFGSLSDKLGRRPVYIAGAVLAVVWAFVFFRLMDSAQPLQICAAVVVGLIIHAMMYGPQAAFVTEQFPTRVRYAGSSLAYTLAGIVGGGFAPLIIASLYKSYGSTLAISLYVSAAVALTLVALLVARETANKPLES